MNLPLARDLRHTSVKPTFRMTSATVRLSVVVPVYNEAATVAEVLHDLLSLETGFDIEVIVVDDGSHDSTLDIVSTFRDPRLRVVRHDRNRGKGEAIRTGMLAATGTHLLPFDADSEYDATDIPRLMDPVLRGQADVVYGARVAGMNTLYTSFWYPLGSWLTTLVANMIFASRLKDLHTCLKLLPMAVVREMPLRETGFGLDTELTARLLKMRLRPYEVPVTYRGRSRDEGKKISWRDGLRCLVILMRVKLSGTAPSQPPSGYTRPSRVRHASVRGLPSHGGADVGLILADNRAAKVP
jgi:dolichol-phosphate hexosyltransferase